MSQPELRRIDRRSFLQIVPGPSTRRLVLEKEDVDLALEVATKAIPDLTRKAGSRSCHIRARARGS